MIRFWRSSRALLFSMFGIYCFIYPSSLILLMFDAVPAGTEWMATFMLALEGIIAAVWVCINYGLRRGLVTSMTILVLAFAVEAIGVTTGFPFGQYAYTTVLSPRIANLVPLGITFAWLMMIIASFFTARLIVARLWPHISGPTGNAVAIGLCALLSVGSDGQMEPVAVHVSGYWTWTGAGEWYGVPVSNFVAWFGTSIVMTLVLLRLLGIASKEARRTPKAMRYDWLPVALYLMNMIMFTAVNLSHSFLVAGFAGTAVVLSVASLSIGGQSTRRRIGAAFSRPAPLIKVESVDNGESLDATL